MDTFWENTYFKKHSGSGSPEAQLTSLIKKCYVINAGPQLTSMIIKKRFVTNTGPNRPS